MREFNMTGLREMVEQIPTVQLDEMLQAELQKEQADENAVRLILQVLNERDDSLHDENGDKTEAAWREYQKKIRTVSLRRAKRRSWIPKVSSTAAAILIIFAFIPQNAEANGFFGRLAAWTDSIFTLFSPGDKPTDIPEYEFRTNHPGLQEVYDVVVELGVTEPVVPMWIPDGYELTDCRMVNSPSKTRLAASISGNDGEIVFEVVVYHSNKPVEFSKDITLVTIYERNGITHRIMRNNDLWIAVWTQDNIECSIGIDCQEETLYRILDSIYVMEDKK